MHTLYCPKHNQLFTSKIDHLTCCHCPRLSEKVFLEKFCWSCGQWHLNAPSSEIHLFGNCGGTPSFSRMRGSITLLSRWHDKTIFLCIDPMAKTSVLRAAILSTFMLPEDYIRYDVLPMRGTFQSISDWAAYNRTHQELYWHFNNFDFVQVIQRDTFDVLLSRLEIWIKKKLVGLGSLNTLGVSQNVYIQEIEREKSNEKSKPRVQSNTETKSISADDDIMPGDFQSFFQPKESQELVSFVPYPNVN